MKNKLIIDLEDMSTWPEDFCEELEKNRELILSYHTEELRIDRLARDDLDTRFNRPDNPFESSYNRLATRLKKIVNGGHLVVYHCTRLTEYEKRDIRDGGLKILTFDLVKNRINLAREKLLLTDEEALYLLNSKDIQHNLKHDGCRVNRLFFCSVKSLLQDKTGVYRLFRSWGGEAVYVGHEEENPKMFHRLRSIGKPCIVKCVIPYEENKMAFRSIAECMISYYLFDNNFGSFEKRVENLIVTIQEWHKQDPDICQLFLDWIGVSFREFDRSNTSNLSLKIKAFMLNLSPPIEEASEDMWQLLTEFSDALRNLLQRNLKSFDPSDFYSSTFFVETHHEFDFMMKRDAKPEEVVDIIDVDCEEFEKLTHYKSWTSYEIL